MLRHPGYTRERIAQVGDRIRALIHADAVAPERLAVAGPVDRIEPAEAELLDYRDCELGETFGPLWASYWFKVEATVPERWQGERVDLLWVSHSEATLWDGGRRAAGPEHQPRRRPRGRHAARGGGRGRAARPARRARLQRPVRRAAAPLRQPRAGGARPLPDRPLRPARLAAAPRLRRAAPARGRARRRARPDLGGRAAVRAEPRLQRLVGARSGHLGRGRGDPGAPARAPQRHRHARAVGDRPRPPRHRLAVAAGRELPQGGAQLQLAGRLHGPLSGVPVRVLAGPAVRLDPTPQPGAVRAHPRTAWSPASGCRWAAPGWSPTATCRRASRSCASSCTASATSSGSSAAAVREFWNPDVFGYNGQLPQIMRGAGIGRFLTQKLSWNRFNPPAHHTFTWQGIDGSQVLAHFPPADTYNATAEVAELRRSVRDYKDHDRSHRSLLVFGYGDGGGGPTPDMLETLRRARDLQGLPRTTITTSDEFFTALEADARDLPAILGELYFEYHRGTYTSQAAVKLGNAQGERALHDAEFLAAVAMREAGAAYPAERLDELWKLLLLNQFHDILPGSSIGLVYEDAARDHAAVLAGAEAVAAGALAAIAGSGPSGAGEHAWSGPGRGGGAAGRRAGLGGGAQLRRRHRCGHRAGRRTCDRAGRRRGARERPAAGRAHPRRPPRLAGAPGGRSRGPGRRRATSSSCTTTGPTAYEAWDIDPFHLETVPGRRAGRVLRRHPAERRCGRRWSCAYRFGTASTLRQLVRLDAGAARLEFHCEVDWRERHTMLKVLFPVAVHSAIRHLPDAVRPRRAAHPLLHQPRPGPLRGARPPLRRPVRARLRRGAPDRLQVRLLDAGRRDADQPAALRRPCPTPRPTPAATGSPTR